MLLELKCIHGKNRSGSYYGKAHVIEEDQGVFLQSYDTVVCGIVDGKIEKYWTGYSATTMWHIHDFLKQSGFSGLDKNEWEKLETVPCPVQPMPVSYKATYY